MTAPSAAVVAAVLSAIQAERVAAFGYGTLGPRLTPGPNTAVAQACEQAHRDLAQSALQLLAASAATTPPGSYQLPIAAVDDASARQLAIELEDACATGWRFTVAQLADAAAGATPLWTLTLAALRDSAVRAVTWRKTVDPNSASVPFPGI